MHRWSVFKSNAMDLENRKWIFISYQLQKKVIDQVNQNFKFHSQRKFYIIKIKENNKNLLCHIIHTKRAWKELKESCIYPFTMGEKKRQDSLFRLKRSRESVIQGSSFMPKVCNTSYQQSSSWSSQDKQFEWAVCYTLIKTKNKCSRHHGSVMFFTSFPTNDLVFIQFLRTFLLVRCMRFWCVPGTSVLTVVVQVDSRQQRVLSLEETPHQQSD